MQIRNIEITAIGRRWNGSWHVDDASGDLVVSSAYGSDRAKPGKDARATAERLMKRIVASKG
ncbi:MAG: hypothetical protein V4597_18490 [Pseudomonadota bacterium]